LEVHREEVIEIRLADVQVGFESELAGGVDETVNAAEALARGAHHRAARGSVRGRPGYDRDRRSVADTLGGVFQFPFVAAVHHHVPAVLEKAARYFEANTARSAGDQCRFAARVHVDAVLPGWFVEGGEHAAPRARRPIERLLLPYRAA